MRNLILEQAVESLEQQGLVEVIKRHAAYGPQLNLTRTGRDLIIELGLVPAAQNTVSNQGEKNG